MPKQYVKVQIAKRKDGELVIAIRKMDVIEVITLYTDGTIEYESITKSDIYNVGGMITLENWGKNLKPLYQRKFLIKPKEHEVSHGR
jgi:hypothetical protein